MVTLPSHLSTDYTFIDIEKAYDKTWLDAVLYMLWNNKIRGKIWRLIKEINSNLTAKCRVCNTESQQIKIDSNLRQGGVLKCHIIC